MYIYVYVPRHTRQRARRWKLLSSSGEVANYTHIHSISIYIYVYTDTHVYRTERERARNLFQDRIFKVAFRLLVLARQRTRREIGRRRETERTLDGNGNGNRLEMGLGDQSLGSSLFLRDSSSALAPPIYIVIYILFPRDAKESALASSQRERENSNKARRPGKLGELQRGCDLAEKKVRSLSLAICPLLRSLMLFVIVIGRQQLLLRSPSSVYSLRVVCLCA